MAFGKGEEGDVDKYDVLYTEAAKEAGLLRVIVDRGNAFFQAGPSDTGEYKGFFHSAIQRQSKERGFCLAATGAPDDAAHWVRFTDFRVEKPCQAWSPREAASPRVRPAARLRLNRSGDGRGSPADSVPEGCRRCLMGLDQFPRTVGVVITTCLAGYGLALPPDQPCLAGDAGPNGRPAGSRPGAVLKVGDKAPEISGWNPDGNALGANDLARKAVLVAFWQLDAKGGGMPVEPLREVRRVSGDGLLILTVCVNGSGDNWDAWSKVLLDQGTVDYGDGARRFIDDSKWWNVTEVSSVKRRSATAYGVVKSPEFFILKSDGTLGGVRVPANELKAAAQKLLK